MATSRELKWLCDLKVTHCLICQQQQENLPVDVMTTIRMSLYCSQSDIYDCAQSRWLLASTVSAEISGKISSPFMEQVQFVSLEEEKKQNKKRFHTCKVDNPYLCVSRLGWVVSAQIPATQ